MSWARIDDGAWEHPKFEAMREAGEYRAIALWVLALSYCGAKRNPRITVREAAMLLCCSEADAQACCDVLRSRGLFDHNSASKQTRSSLIHDWDQYRSKDEAKSLAGRQGGVKSGESRRSKREANAKQTRSRHEADAKQTRSPDPDPDPDPDPICSLRSPRGRARYSADVADSPGAEPPPVAPPEGPEPDELERAVARADSPPPRVPVPSGLDELERAVARAGIAVYLSASDRARWAKLYPVEPHELEHAVARAIERRAKRTSYVLGVIEGERQRAAEAPSQPRARASPSEVQSGGISNFIAYARSIGALPEDNWNE